MPAPKKPSRDAQSKASRPEVHPLGEHLAELLNPALVEPKPQGSAKVWGAAAAEIRERGARQPSARPHRRDGERGIAEGPARRGRSQHPQPAAVDAPPAAAAGKVRRRTALPRRFRIRAGGRPAAGDRGTGQGRARPRARPGAARRHRLGQDLHHGQGDRGDPAPGARSSRPTRRSPRSSTASSGASFPTMRSSISSPTTTITSRRPMFRAPTPISRRNPTSTSRSTACATPRRARCWSATTSSSSPRSPASTASARSRPIPR